MSDHHNHELAAVNKNARKQRLERHFDNVAPQRDLWTARNQYYHTTDWDYFRFIIPPGKRVLALGCETGDVLHAVKPCEGVGIDISPQMIRIARDKYPELTFHAGDVENPAVLNAVSGPFDFIILSNTIGYLDDCQATLELLHQLCNEQSRLVIAYYSWKWEPILKLGEWLRLRIPTLDVNFLSTQDIQNLLALSDFDLVKWEWRQLVPRRMFGLGPIINRYIGTLPGIRRLALRNYIIARSMRVVLPKSPSCTVLIPCRNEKGNIEAAVQRLPRFCDDIEILFVEGQSQDGTFEECRRVQQAYADYEIKVTRQDGKGKGDAVRKGFDLASGEVLIILDADLTTPPEDMPKFYHAIASGKGEFINGSRLVYPMEDQAMRFLNLWANRCFSWLFTWLLNQRFTDTLCGTKALSKADYEKIAASRAYFGEFDPFGDFDLIFGAVKQNLKIVEIPVRYGARQYGTTQISRFRHGWLLMRMVLFAWRKLKAL